MITMTQIQEAEKPLYALRGAVNEDEQPVVAAFLEGATVLLARALQAAAGDELRARLPRVEEQR